MPTPPKTYGQWELTHTNPITWRCRKCGHVAVFKTAANVGQHLDAIDHCPDALASSRQASNSWITWAAHYGTAVARWIAAGRPIRTPADAEAIYRLHCKPCPHLAADHDRCKLCGCTVGRWGSVLTSKLRMATETCPDDPPRWTGANQPDPIEPTIDRNTWITDEDLITHTLQLASRLPHLTDVVGVARSGLIPAALIAAHAHARLHAITPDTLIHTGTGNRAAHLTTAQDPQPQPTTLLIDDTVFTGATLLAAEKQYRQQHPDRPLITAAVYATPTARLRVDLAARILDGPHYLSWNFPNSHLALTTAWDLDGIMNWHAKDNPFTAPDGLPWLRPIRNPIPLILTARPETHRFHTERWLAQYRIRYRQLTMAPWTEYPPDQAIATWKASHYAKSPTTLLIESNPTQASTIAALAKKPVLCPETRKVYP